MPRQNGKLGRTFRLTEKAKLDFDLRAHGLLDSFLGLKTTLGGNPRIGFVDGIGQVEIDAFYLALDGEKQTSAIAVLLEPGCAPIKSLRAQRLARYAETLQPQIPCRAVLIQRLEDDCIGLFEVDIGEDGVNICREAHYRLS